MKGIQWIYILSMAFAAFAFGFVCYCELTGGIIYPNPRMSLMWAVCLPSLIAVFVQFRDQRLFDERRKQDKGRTLLIIERLERKST